MLAEGEKRGSARKGIYFTCLRGQTRKNVVVNLYNDLLAVRNALVLVLSRLQVFIELDRLFRGLLDFDQIRSQCSK